MSVVDKAIIDSLMINMGYKKGEKVAIVAQICVGETKAQHKAFSDSINLTNKMFDVIQSRWVEVKKILYRPDKLQHGVDATQEAYNSISEFSPDIVFIPSVYSLTHTPFRKMLTEKGARVASMPTFTLNMFEKGGPMAVDSKAVKEECLRIKSLLEEGPLVRIIDKETRGRKTDIVIEHDPSLVHVSSGLMTEPGEYGNLPGAETYTVPTHKGKSKGYFTVPIGWGGSSPLEHSLVFTVKKGRIVKVAPCKENSKLQQAYARQIFNKFLGKRNYNILAELGIGANPNITADYINKNGWSPLTAEKIVNSAHFANGNSKAMGGKNDVPIHIDWVVPNIEIIYGYATPEKESRFFTGIDSK